MIIISSGSSSSGSNTMCIDVKMTFLLLRCGDVKKKICERGNKRDCAIKITHKIYIYWISIHKVRTNWYRYVSKIRK